MSDIIKDGFYDLPVEVSKVISSAPFPSVAAHYIFRQQFWQSIDDFVAEELSVAHPDIPDSHLVEESELQPVLAGVGEWTRTYAKVPATWSSYETTNYQFVGYIYGNTSAGNNEAREPFTEVISSRVQHDYFLVGEGQDYETPLQIPIIQAREYYGTGGPAYPVRILGGISTPTKDQYINSIIGTEIAAESSALRLWMGKIYERSTRYIIAR